MAQINLLNNWSFERDGDWTLLDEAIYVSENASHGSRSLRCTNIFPSVINLPIMHARQTRNVVPGKTYTVRFYVTFPSLKNVTPYISCFATSSTGQQYLQDFQVPASDLVNGTKSFSITLPNWSDSLVPLVIYLDSLKISGTANGQIWLDSVELLGDDSWFVTGDRGAGNDQLVNGNFETTEGWSFYSDAGYSTTTPYEGARCLRFPINTVSNRQMAYQTVRVVKGSPYTLSFMAKRIGVKDLWAHYSYTDANGVTQYVHFPSLLDSTCEVYTLQTHTFTVPSDASSDQIEVTLNAGDYTGGTADAFIDDAQLRGETPKPGGAYGIVANVPSGQTVFVRHAANPTSGYLGRWQNGAKFTILGEQGNGVRIIWGKDWSNGAPTEDGWIQNDFVESITMSTSFVDRYVEMALSFVGHQASAWGYDDKYAWCQSFINNMAISAGLTDVENKILINSNTWDCYTWLRDHGAYTSEDLLNCEIRKGDWVYYRYKDEDNTSHVAIVTDVMGAVIKTVAGNFVVRENDPHIVGTQDWFFIGDVTYKVRAIARPNW